MIFPTRDVALVVIALGLIFTLSRGIDSFVTASLAMIIGYFLHEAKPKAK